MALIKCPDCEKEFSEMAPACPNCGRPNVPKRNKINFKEQFKNFVHVFSKIPKKIYIIFASIIAIVIIGIIAFDFFVLTNYEKIQVEDTIDLIDDIGTVNSESGELIIAAENSYDELDFKCKIWVKNKNILTDSRKE